MNRETKQDQLERLATRICAGEVVFFIGAGFSLDSEGNTAQLLVTRLLARLEALTMGGADSEDSELKDLAGRLREGLRTTFSLEKAKNGFSDLFDSTDRSDGGPSVLVATVRSLAQNYYQINDWACSAFENLIASFEVKRPSPQFFAAANARENHLLQRFKADARLDPIDLDWLLRLRQHALDHPDPRERMVAGKALFLETLGFASENVMGGKPMHPDLDEVVLQSDRVRPRHHVIAWLAAEGLAPTLVTTNYDLLLECAFRMAGMLPLSPPPELWTDSNETPLKKAERLKLPLNRRYRHFTRVKDASDFFTYGDAHEAATIHKIHGDVAAYRIARNDPTRFRRLLPSIVFTFREIQNWREDSWSRDYLSTLLRTRTIVFSGYSGADPVIHDTFRTVYEEIAGYRAPAHNGAATPKTTASRAFFTDVEQTRSFHGLEILRASSRAAGAPSLELTEHPNLLTFYLEKENAFPHLDEMFIWTYHMVARELQKQALEAEVGRIAYQLFHRPCPKEEVDALLSSFDKLKEQEKCESSQWEERKGELARRDYRRMTNWTSVFHRRLMRQYQVAESLHRNPSEAFAVYGAARYPWYAPMTEHPQWCAWGAILEMAIRRMGAVYLGDPKAWELSTADLVVAEQAPGPAVRFRANCGAHAASEPPVWRLLCVELGAERRLFPRKAPHRAFAALKPKSWELRPETIPWWTERDGRIPQDTPSAREVWIWAAFGAERRNERNATVLLGGSEFK
jgi:hypothetical protein